MDSEINTLQYLNILKILTLLEERLQWYFTPRYIRRTILCVHGALSVRIKNVMLCFTHRGCTLKDEQTRCNCTDHSFYQRMGRFHPEWQHQPVDYTIIWVLIERAVDRPHFIWKCFQTHAPHNVLTLQNRAFISRWMVNEVFSEQTERKIQSKSIGQFPQFWRSVTIPNSWEQSVFGLIVSCY